MDDINISNTNWCKAQVITVANSSDTLQAFFIEFGRLHGFLGTAVCLFGIISNLANILVLTRPRMLSPTNSILMWLAVADLLTMAPYLPQLVKFSILHEAGALYQHTNSYFWIRYHEFVVSFVIICHSAAIWLTVTLGIFRYIYIAQTMRGWPSYANERSARIATLVVYVFSVAITLPNTIVNKVESCWQNVTNTNQSEKYYFIRANEMYTLQAINFWIQAVVVKIIPCILMTITTIVLIDQLRIARSRRKTLIGSSHSREKQDRRTTIMLLSIVGFFILTEFPQGVMLIQIRYDKTFYLRVYTKLGDVIDFITLCNQSINFLLYTSMSKDFRKAFSENLIQPVFFCCKPRQQLECTFDEKECLTITTERRLKKTNSDAEIASTNV